MKRKHSVGYFSSYDRGLVCLLEMWPKIRAQVPDATLDIYYGWNIFDKRFSHTPEMMQWKWHIIRTLSDLKDQGVAEHGRVNHQALAKAMQDIAVWAYPTEFTEIHCITALKVQEAGCWPVTTDIAALNETVVNGDKIHSSHIYSDPKAQQEFIDAICEALKSNKKPKKDNLVPNRYWTDVAHIWDETIR